LDGSSLVIAGTDLFNYMINGSRNTNLKQVGKMKTVIVKFEKAEDGTLWGRCKAGGNLYVEAGINKAAIIKVLSALIDEDYHRSYKLRIAKYHKTI
jgi:hypothetical protein